VMTWQPYRSRSDARSFGLDPGASTASMCLQPYR
jgi:hypothetical protein